MATLDPEALDALNALLEETRASVEIELALADGATELREQDTLVAMGGEEVLVCCALRERLTLAAAPVTWRISGIVFRILETERYDERLLAFARHQAAICERAQALLPALADAPTHRLLLDLYDSHVRSAQWAEQRANQFAATRLLDFTLLARARLAAAHAQANPDPGGSTPAAPVPLATELQPEPAALSPDAGATDDTSAVGPDAEPERAVEPPLPAPAASQSGQSSNQPHQPHQPHQHNGHAAPDGLIARDDASPGDEPAPDPDTTPRQE